MPSPCLPFPSLPSPPLCGPHSRPARLGPARSGVSGKPYRRLSRDKGGFGWMGEQAAARGTKKIEGATLNRGGERGGEGLGGPIGVTSQKEISLSPPLCPAVVWSFSHLDVGPSDDCPWDARTYVYCAAPSCAGWECAVDLTWAGGPGPHPSNPPPLHSSCLVAVLFNFHLVFFYDHVPFLPSRLSRD